MTYKEIYNLLCESVDLDPDTLYMDIRSGKIYPNDIERMWFENKASYYKVKINEKYKTSNESPTQYPTDYFVIDVFRLYGYMRQRTYTNEYQLSKEQRDSMERFIPKEDHTNYVRKWHTRFSELDEETQNILNKIFVAFGYTPLDHYKSLEAPHPQ